MMRSIRRILPHTYILFAVILLSPLFLASAQETHSERIEFLNEQAVISFTKQDYEVAKQLFREILELDPTNEEAKTYLEKKIPQEVSILNKEKIKPLYREAFKAYHAKEYEKSREYFLKILEIDPEHKKAQRYAEDIIPEVLQRRKIRGLYDEALQAYNINDLETATDLFKVILDLDPEQKKARQYLDRKISYQIKVLQKKKIKALYRDAFALYYQRDYEGSRDVFLRILELDPNQKEANYYGNHKIPFILTRNQVHTLFEEARQAYKDKDYERASSLFKEILALDPQHPEADRYLKKRLPRMMKILTADKIILLSKEATSLYHKGDYKASGELFEQVLALDPDHRKSHLYLEKKIPKRLETLKRKRMRRLYKEAFHSFRKKRFKESQELFLQVIEIDPDQERARRYAQEIIPKILTKAKIKSLYNEGQKAYFNKEYEKADMLFKRILELDPYHKKAKYYVNKKIPKKLGIAKRKTIRSLYVDARKQYNAKNYEGADKLFRKILAIDPTEEKARYYITEKIPRLLNKENINSLYEEAIRLYQNGNYEAASQVFTEILDLDPNHNKAKYYLNSKIPEKMVHEDKRRIEILYGDAFGYFNAGQYRKAEAVFKQILSLDPDQEKARTYIEKIIPRELASQQRKGERVLDAFAATPAPQPLPEPEEISPVVRIEPRPVVEEIRPSEPIQRPYDRGLGFLYDQAFAYYNRGEYINAHRYFEKILALDPDQSTARDYLGFIKERAALEREQ